MMPKGDNEMVRDHNFDPGNTFVCNSDFGVPISL
jgi:hypothetical protein